MQTRSNHQNRDNEARSQVQGHEGGLHTHSRNEDISETPNLVPEDGSYVKTYARRYKQDKI